MAAGAELPVPAGLAASFASAIRLTDPPYNAKADAVRLTDGAMGVSGTTLTSASASFTSADVGKAIAVEGAGVSTTGIGKTANGANTLTQTWVTVKITASSGTWAYTHTGPGTVSGIAYNVTANTLKTSLEAIYGAGKVTVTLAGTTYTISLLSGAANTDTTLISVDGTGLAASAGAAPAAATLTYQNWTYQDVGRRVHIPGAGAGGSVLTAWIGSIEPTTSNIAYLYDTAPNLTGVQGSPLNASAAVVGSYYELAWARGTISAVTSATTLTTSFTVDAGVQAVLTGLEVHYGTDNASALSSAITAARSAGKPLDLGAGTYLATAGPTSTGTSGFTMYGAGMNATIIRMIPVDSEAESGRLAITGTADSTAGRAKGVNLRDFAWHVPTAHLRGSGNAAGLPNPKTNANGIFIGTTDFFAITGVRTENCYGTGILIQNCRYGLVDHCRVEGAWGDGIDIVNANAGVPANSGAGTPGTSDISVTGCEVYNAGDDMFSIDQYNCNGRISRISFTGCRGYGTRQLGTGRGVAVNGGDDVTVSGCEVYNTDGSGFDVDCNTAKNAGTATISAPSTGATVVWASAPANITAGATGTTRTQMRLFNGATGTTWVGEVLTTSGDGLTQTLEAVTGSATTCPFTGAGNLVQWGLNNDGFRFSAGSSRRVVFSGCLSDGSNLAPSSDGTLNAAFRVRGGPASTEATTDVVVTGLTLKNCYQTGVMVDTTYTSGKSDVASADLLASDISITGLSINGTGYSTLTSTRPWPGIYLRNGSHVTIAQAKIRDTADGALLVANSGVAGRVRLINVEGSDIGRSPQTPPVTSAFDFGTSTGLAAHVEALFLTNPSGTSGGTKYVSTNVLSEVPSGSTVRGVNTDISGQNLVVESASRYRVVVSPVMFRGKGTPEGTVTAGVGAIYERTDGAAGSAIYVKESGTGNTGWIAYATPGGSPAPELDFVYGTDPGNTYGAAVWGLANRCYLVRLRGNGSISNINFTVKVQSGNVMAGLYANNGSAGRNARPTGAPILSSALTATGSAGATQTLSLGGSQTISHLNYWGAILADNITISTDRLTSTAGDGTGFAHSYDSGSSALETIGTHTLGAAGSYIPFIFGS